MYQCWNIINWTLSNKLQWNFNRNSCIFIQENSFENVVWNMATILSQPQCVNVLRLKQNGNHIAEMHFQIGFPVWKLLYFDKKILLKFILRGPNNSSSALVQITAWCWSGSKPLFESVFAYCIDTYMCHLTLMRSKWDNTSPLKFLYGFSRNFHHILKNKLLYVFRRDFHQIHWSCITKTIWSFGKTSSQSQWKFHLKAALSYESYTAIGQQACNFHSVLMG